MKRVFLSFRYEDRQQVDGLRLLAANPNFDLEFYDESVRVAIDSTNADYVKRVIREKINRASITLCLLSPATYTSAWVNWELETSYAKPNRVLYMGLKGVTGDLILPLAAKNHGATWYTWDPDFLLRWLEGA